MEEEVAAEEKEEPLMLQNSTRWDNFLNFIRLDQRPWPQGVADSNTYREGRAVEAFNAYTPPFQNCTTAIRLDDFLGEGSYQNRMAYSRYIREPGVLVSYR